MPNSLVRLDKGTGVSAKFNPVYLDGLCPFWGGSINRIYVALSLPDR